MIRNLIILLLLLRVGGSLKQDWHGGIPMVQPDAARPIEEQPPLVLLPITVWGEARGQSYEAKVCVAHVIINRSNKWKRPLKSVMLQKWQFSIFNENDPNREKLLKAATLNGEKVWRDCVSATWEALVSRSYDPTKGATHYYTGRHRPSWAKKMKKTLDVGPFHFFRSS